MAPSASCAYFLDFDGTLVALADTPDAVRVDAGLRRTLAALADATGGAVALVSGRSLVDLDALLHPLRLAAAGVHGGELRLSGRGEVRRGEIHPLSAEERRGLSRLQQRHRRVVLEDKGGAVALHYRCAPEAADACLALASRLVATAPEHRTLQRGKMVAEVKLTGGDKGEVVRTFMRAMPFAGRRPVFLGDDVTDEAGFAAAMALGGLAIKVGEGDTAAPCRLSGPAAVIDWLAAMTHR